MAAEYNNSLRIPRSRAAPRTASSRQPSSAALFDDGYHRQASASSSGGYHGLRSTDSRFSLNEQFAATRRDYDFDDDASSVFERMTVASEAGDASWEKILTKDEAALLLEEDGLLGPPPGDYYDILCLPCDAELSRDQIRRAYYRLFLLFYPESYPEHLQPIAQRQWQRVQEAFETLIDPSRRAVYDIARAEDVGGAGRSVTAPRETIWRDPIDGYTTSSDLTIHGNSPGNGWSDRRSTFDFICLQSATFQLPSLRKFLQEQGLVTTIPEPKEGDKPASEPRNTATALTVTGGVHKTSPALSLKLRRQALKHHLEAAQQSSRLTDVAELEFDILPQPSLTHRTHTPITLPHAAHPTLFECNAHTGPLHRPEPHFLLGAHHPLLSGTAFVRLDSGNGLTGRPWLSVFRKCLPSAVFFNMPPSAEVGFTTASYGRQVTSSALRRTRHDEAGLRSPELDVDVSTQGSWTVAASTSSVSTAAYLRYSKDLAQVQLPGRHEVELCANPVLGSQLAVRSLWPAGRFSKAGLDIAFSSRSVCLSIYWSRLNHRISFPILICHQPAVLNRIASAAALYFAGIAALRLWTNRPRRTSKPKTTAQDSVVRHRLEADRLSALLAAPVDARQKRQRSLDGLVILSAKYGVQDEQGSWGGEEVADVTLAVAALVDKDGSLTIPQSVRKGYLPGFWDPAPTQPKVLHVRYSWKGKEAVVESKGDEELTLPPREA